MPRFDDYHRYHGAALALIAEDERFTSINKIPDLASRSIYLINHDRAIYVKHSTSEDLQWRFTFSPTHQEEVRHLYDRYHDRTYIVLVCNDEICGLTYGEYASCLDQNYREAEWLEVWRPEGGQFRVRGALRDLPRKIPLNRFPGFLFE